MSTAQLAAVKDLLKKHRTDEAVTSAKEALDSAKEGRDSELEVESRLILCEALLANGDFSEAKDIGEEAISVQKDNDNDGTVRVMALVSKLYLNGGQAADAVTVAQQALTMAQEDLKDEAQEVVALDALVQAQIGGGSIVDALRLTKEEQAYFVQTKNQVAQAATLRIMAYTYIAKEDTAGALATVKEAMDLLKDMGDKTGEARALVTECEVYILMGEWEEAMQSAQLAAVLAKQAKDKDTEAAAAEYISAINRKDDPVYNRQIREDALQVIEDMVKAVEEKDGALFEKLEHRVDKMAGWSEADLYEAIKDLMQEDREGTTQFLNLHSFRFKGQSKSGPSGPEQLRHVEKTFNYMCFRFGGIAYGPRYRGVQQAFKRTGETGTGALSCLRAGSMQEDWERQLGYHPAMLDGSLQTGQAMAIV